MGVILNAREARLRGNPPCGTSLHRMVWVERWNPHGVRAKKISVSPAKKGSGMTHFDDF